MRKLIRNELVDRGFKVDHESPSMLVATKADRRIVVTPSGRCEVWNRNGLRWRLVNEVRDIPLFLKLLRAGVGAKRGRDSET